MRFGLVIDDGGRSKSGFRNVGGDCVTRAIAVACKLPYYKVFHDIDRFIDETEDDTFLKRTNKYWGGRNDKSNPYYGVHFWTYKKYLEKKGWKYISFLNKKRESEYVLGDCIPDEKEEIIVRLRKGGYSHVVAAMNGVLYDTFDCRNWRVEGYFKRLEEK